MNPAKTMVALGILPENPDPRLARPEPAGAASIFSLLDVPDDSSGEGDRIGGPRFDLSWEASDFETFKSCMSGFIGKILTLYLVNGEQFEVQVMDLRISQGVGSLLCRERKGKRSNEYAPSILAPNKLTIPVSSVIRVHVGSIAPN